MKVDSAGAIVTVESTGYSVVVRGMPADAELSPLEAKALAELLRTAGTTP